MKHTYFNTCLLWTGVWLAAPVFASAAGLPHTGEGWSIGSPLIHKVQSTYYGSTGTLRDRLAGPGFDEPNPSEKNKEVREEKSQDDHGLTPSPDIFPSVHGHTGRDRSSLSDPSVRGLSEMDRGGFAPTGSYTGTERRP
ncbi:exported hypothetical protein [Candidatus Nitrospira nitrificans]|uniref:Uncharacterized protein n=1 Tax=Candidatus Nitrospira nitrificans TaxID=1742973 RepID=A0A0S4L892_9BACT|nr:exported hypothetical protein [Candidatus Nitrospira nitrificans]